MNVQHSVMNVPAEVSEAQPEAAKATFCGHFGLHLVFWLLFVLLAAAKVQWARRFHPAATPFDQDPFVLFDLYLPWGCTVVFFGFMCYVGIPPHLSVGLACLDILLYWVSLEVIPRLKYAFYSSAFVRFALVQQAKLRSWLFDMEDTRPTERVSPGRLIAAYLVFLFIFMVRHEPTLLASLAESKISAMTLFEPKSEYDGWIIDMSGSERLSGELVDDEKSGVDETAGGSVCFADVGGEPDFICTY